MSVINQMLKELDQRNNATGAVLETSTSSGYVIAEQTNRYRLLPIVIIVILMVAGVYYVQLIDGQQVIDTKMFETRKPEAMELVSTPSTNNVIAESSPPRILEDNQSSKTAPNDNIQPVIEQPVLSVLQTTTATDTTKSELQTSENTSGIQKEAVEQMTIATETQRVVKSELKPDVIAQGERLYKTARLKLEERQISEAITLLGQALKYSEMNHKARILLFSLLFQQQQLDTLQPQLEKSLIQWPAIHEYRQVKARLLLQKAQNDEAIRLLEMSIPAVAEAPEYHNLLAYIAQQAKRDKLAVKHYQLLLSDNPDRADWWLGLAISEDRMGNSTTALQAFNQAVARPGLTRAVQAYAQKRIKALQGY